MWRYFKITDFTHNVDVNPVRQRNPAGQIGGGVAQSDNSVSLGRPVHAADYSWLYNTPS